MAITAYTSFLLRCWRTADGGGRIVIEHVQSGERTAAANLDAALAWIAARSDGTEEAATDDTARNGRGRAPGVGDRAPP
jgi:hypothetical protein